MGGGQNPEGGHAGAGRVPAVADLGWALITGASGGIGAAWAEQLAAQGRNLLIAARSADKLAVLKRDWQQRYGVEVRSFKVDLAQVEGAMNLWQWAQAQGPITYLVNNAGRGTFGAFGAAPVAESQGTLTLNINSVVSLCHAAINHMKAHGKPATIVNIASVVAYVPVEKFAVYCASKAFVKSFSLALANELKGSNIRVTVVHPGGTKTGFMTEAKQELSQVAEKSLMSPQQVATIGIQAAAQGQASVVTGFSNKCLTVLPKLLPEVVTSRLVSAVFTTVAKEAAPQA